MGFTLVYTADGYHPDCFVDYGAGIGSKYIGGLEKIGSRAHGSSEIANPDPAIGTFPLNCKGQHGDGKYQLRYTSINELLSTKYGK